MDEERQYKDIPCNCKVRDQEILDNYLQLKLEVNLIIEQEMKNLRSLKRKSTK